MDLERATAALVTTPEAATGERPTTQFKFPATATVARLKGDMETAAASDRDGSFMAAMGGKLPLAPVEPCSKADT
jgi:hypothetical protein